MTNFNIRCIEINGIVYLRREDVIDLIKDVGSTEETDVRNRLYKLADNLGMKENKFPACDALSEKHNHFGEVFMPDSCPACKALK